MKTLISLCLASLVFVMGQTQAETFARYTSSDGVAKIEFDGMVIESMNSNQTRLSKKIQIRKNVNDLTIEDPNTGILICIGVDSCNNMIVYCAEEGSTPSCSYNDQGQPVACVC